eukprot:CAMPEP_0204904506 /NCGR_PEP_ID=MMETSP1397-20131031/4901_1 /ASSEMBLY_ACC=CAM_ASM_000891 /TAXON_ID=49980 /ORGANISM="Climacostomum Climacostomum virens, Strain Stock W-24" /LENGTH=235 /DNA_ID=CAMNT_0052073301 /DNA_START=83 /DNA_END=790 /DNA_ORIENTATION=+
MDSGTLDKYITPPQFTKRSYLPVRSSSPYLQKPNTATYTPSRNSPARTSRGGIQSESKTEGLMKKLRAWEERAKVWAKERREFQRHMESCGRTIKGEKLFKKAWHRKSSLGYQLESQCSQQLQLDPVYFENTSRLEDLKHTAHSSNVVSDDETFTNGNCNFKKLMRDNQETIAKLKILLKEESIGKAKLEEELAQTTTKLGMLEQHVQSLEYSLKEIYQAVGTSQENYWCFPSKM